MWFVYVFVAGIIAFIIYAVYHQNKEKEKEQARQNEKICKELYEQRVIYNMETLKADIRKQMKITYKDLPSTVQNYSLKKDFNDLFLEIIENEVLDDNMFSYLLGVINNQDKLLQIGQIVYNSYRQIIFYSLACLDEGFGLFKSDDGAIIITGVDKMLELFTIIKADIMFCLNQIKVKGFLKDNDFKEFYDGVLHAQNEILADVFCLNQQEQKEE